MPSKPPSFRRSTRQQAQGTVVLNVNDNEAALYMTTVMLRSAGFSVIEAADGRSALRLVEQLPEVVVLDVRLPDIDGFEVCRRIRANPRTKRVKVLHTSATFVTMEKRVQGLEMGADGYLAQPFESQELVATVHSLARLSKAEADLRKRADELLEADRRKDEFLAMLGHELRNPLSAITVALPLLAVGEDAAEIEGKAYEVVQRQVSHLTRLVNDLLDVARVTRGKIELDAGLLNLNEVLSAVVETTRDTLTEARGQRLLLELPSVPLHVHGDCTRLEQVFANLLENASKYSESEGEIIVDLCSEGGEAVVSIRDNGVGMAPETLRSIFELFSQANVPLDRSRGGLGVGLSLVKTLVGLHGGEVAAFSEGVGKGTLLQVKLPLVATDEDAATESDGGHAETSSAVAPKRRILLVEDNDDAREGLARLWRSWGHEVITAVDGPTGLHYALSEAFDIVFLDIGLPVLDGYEVAQRIRGEETCRDVTLVALTGYGAPGQQVTSHEAGFDHHFMKPVEVRKFKELLETLPPRPARVPEVDAG